MVTLDIDADEAAFLGGGGATGALIRKYDWASTPLGPLGAWPQSLKGATALVLQASLPMAILWGPDGVTLYNDPYSVLLGTDHPATLGSKACDTSPVIDLAQRAIRTGLAGRTLALRDLELTVKRSGKRETVWFNIDCSPLLDDHGRPAGVLSLVVDTTARVLAERKVALEVERLQRVQQRLTASLEVARLGAYEMDLATGEAVLDDRAREIFGFGPDETITVLTIRRRIPECDLARLNAEFAAVEASGCIPPQLEHQIQLPDGSVRVVASLAEYVRGASGKVLRIAGVFYDVTERRRAEMRQRLLINELNHRVKNTLATVQSLARQTLRSGADPQDANHAFEARLLALSEAHNLLNRETWQGADLCDLAACVMAPFKTIGPPQISVAGPPTWLAPPTALALGMALQELASNAAKHGALSCPEGRVAVSWSVANSSQDLTLSWVEKGGPPVSPPVRKSFGLKLLERSLPRELGGAVDLDFAPEGVRCEIRCKLKPLVPAPEFDSGAL